MKNISDNYKLKGFSFYQADSGRIFKIQTIYDRPSSHHGNEVFRLVGTQVNEDGSTVMRMDGKPAVDQVGHMISHQSSGETSLQQTYERAITSYVEQLDRAAEAHQHAWQIDFVEVEDAEHVPYHLNHLNEGKRDAYGRKLQ